MKRDLPRYGVRYFGAGTYTVSLGPVIVYHNPIEGWKWWRPKRSPYRA